MSKLRCGRSLYSEGGGEGGIECGQQAENRLSPRTSYLRFLPPKSINSQYCWWSLKPQIFGAWTPWVSTLNTRRIGVLNRASPEALRPKLDRGGGLKWNATLLRDSSCLI